MTSSNDATPVLDSAEPVVGRVARGANPAVIAGGFAVAAVLLFVVLNARRTDAAARPALEETARTAAWASPPPLELPTTLVSNDAPGPFSGLPPQVFPIPAPSPPAALAAPMSPPDEAAGRANLIQRLRAPAVVVDLGGGPKDTSLAQAGVAPGEAQGAAGPSGGQRSQLNESEQFAKRVGDEEPDRARAVSMRNLDSIAPQGTVIPGVLETAINSDLPGFTRAVVSRDVLSFDGKAVLIPRGSRLIGQYKSAVALGQSRAFIIWTRVIRPDGVSIQIGSPGTDELGRGGLDGEVNRHFFRRFSGAILLSVLNAGVASIGETPSTQISIGSSGAATGLATSALQGDAIPPTIKVRQGEAINIFVARDLDFSGVARNR